MLSLKGDLEDRRNTESFEGIIVTNKTTTENSIC